MSLVRVKIDDEEIEVPEGTLVITAAEKLGKSIPHFCYHERLTPVAACRLCLVEIEGMPGLQPSCATKVKDGMIVRTNTKNVLDSHKSVLDLVLETHPLDCPKCEATGRCKLEDFTYEFGPHRVSYYRPPGISAYDYEELSWSPVLKFDPYKCVECSRCIRVCDEVQDCRALVASSRGHNWRITTFTGGPLHCDFCGACASVCPTGAIEQQPGKFWKKDWELEKHFVICSHCGHGCTLLLRGWEGRIARIEDDFKVGINRANICSRGRFGFDIISHSSRLSKPLLRSDGKLVEVTWEKALFAAMEMITASHSVIGLASGMLSVEELFLFSKLLASRNGKKFSESRDGDVIEFEKKRLGRYGSTHGFDQLDSFESIVLVDIPVEDLDEVLRIDLISAAKKSGVKLFTAGRASFRLKKRIAGLFKINSQTLASAPAKTLFVVDTERIEEKELSAILEKVSSDPFTGILFVAAQSNSRALSSFSFRVLPSDEISEVDLMIAAGPLQMTERPTSVKRLIASASFRNELVESADLVFPAALPFEKSGTYVNSEGRAQYSDIAVPMAGESWPDAVIWISVMKELGEATPSTPREILDEVRNNHPELFERNYPVKSSEAEPKLPSTRLAPPKRHRGLLLDKSEWLRKLQEHLDFSKEFSPWF